MVLSNAERQRRYIQRLKLSAEGVTPEMILKAARLMFHKVMDEYGESGKPGAETFDEFMDRCRSKRGRASWMEMLPYGLDPEDYTGFGDDAELMLKVAAVVDAVKAPPAKP